MRVYVPSTLPVLRAAVEARELPALQGYAVTPALREWYVGGDDEQLEYAALTQAARASLGLIASDGSEPRRIVVACDIAAAGPSASSELGSAEVTLSGTVPWSDVAAVHVDAAEAADLVATAAAVWDAAQNGDDDAVFAVEACEGEDLLWYATQEVAVLIALDGETRKRS